MIFETDLFARERSQHSFPQASLGSCIESSYLNHGNSVVLGDQSAMLQNTGGYLQLQRYDMPVHCFEICNPPQCVIIR